MGRLIEAEKLWKAITTQIEEYCDITDLIEIIETQPTVDAVEVVRCRDCQWFDDDSVIYDGYCDKNGLAVDEDDFCAWAARREER